MNINIQQAMQDFVSAQSLDRKEISQFSPEDFRHGVQWLVAESHHDLAQALAEAGLSLYPASEDILAITSLLSVVREDWPQAVDLLKQLMEMQAGRATVFTHSMLIRSLRCNLDLAEAFEASGVALGLFPDHPELLKEYDALAEALGLGAVQR